MQIHEGSTHILALAVSLVDYLVKAQTLGIYIEDSTQGILVTVNGSLTNLSAFGSFAAASSFPPQPGQLITNTAAVTMYGEDPKDYNHFSEVDITLNSLTWRSNFLSDGEVTNVVPWVSFDINNGLFLGDEYTQGDILDGTILFAGETLEDNAFLELAQTNVSGDGGAAGEQTILFQVGVFATPMPSSAPSDSPMPTLSPAEDDCPCGRFQFICRVINGCLFGFNN